MSNHYKRGPYTRYLTDDDGEIPETTLRRRRLEAAEEQCPQAETYDHNEEDVRHEEESLSSNIHKSPSDSSTSDTSENNEPDRSNVDELITVSSTTDRSANNEPDHSSSDDGWSDQTRDVSNESLDHDVYDALDPERNNETADEVNAESEMNDESFRSGNHSSDEDDNVDP